MLSRDGQPQSVAGALLRRVQPLERLEQLEYDLSILSTMIPFAAVNYIRHGIGYEDYLKEYAQMRRIKAEELIDVLDAIDAYGLQVVQLHGDESPEICEDLSAEVGPAGGVGTVDADVAEAVNFHVGSLCRVLALGVKTYFL